MKLYHIHWTNPSNNDSGVVKGDALPYNAAREMAEKLNGGKLNKKLKLRYFVRPEVEDDETNG